MPDNSMTTPPPLAAADMKELRRLQQALEDARIASNNAVKGRDDGEGLEGAYWVAKGRLQDAAVNALPSLLAEREAREGQSIVTISGDDYYADASVARLLAFTTDAHHETCSNYTATITRLTEEREAREGRIERLEKALTMLVDRLSADDMHGPGPDQDRCPICPLIDAGHIALAEASHGK